jgi:hypothetical protein
MVFRHDDHIEKSRQFQVRKAIRLFIPLKRIHKELFQCRTQMETKDVAAFFPEGCTFRESLKSAN